MISTAEIVAARAALIVAIEAALSDDWPLDGADDGPRVMATMLGNRAYLAACSADPAADDLLRKAADIEALHADGVTGYAEAVDAADALAEAIADAEHEITLAFQNWEWENSR